MDETSFEIRVCESCGLRYPLVEGHPHGTRCPICMGATRPVLRRELIIEPPRANEQRNLSPSASVKKKAERAVLLDNIRSGWNVGSIFRSADGFGFTHAYLCGITPTPENDAVQKTSLGAEDSVPWSYHKDAVQLVKGLRREGWIVFGLEEDPRGTAVDEIGPSAGAVRRDSVLIVGNEITGVDPGLLELCDRIVTIPMLGAKKSLNAAIAFGVAAYALTPPRR
jgi:23S rRNA (guanosine2251-2'-O)-methyltransferase